MLSRRSFLIGAPAIVTFGSLMPVRALEELWVQYTYRSDNPFLMKCFDVVGMDTYDDFRRSLKTDLGREVSYRFITPPSPMIRGPMAIIMGLPPDEH